jgi:hypothetical protein
MLQAMQLLAEGKRVYESGDRLAAMSIYEEALAQVGGWWTLTQQAAGCLAQRFVHVLAHRGRRARL